MITDVTYSYNCYSTIYELNHVLNRTINTAPEHDDIIHWFLKRSGDNVRNIMLEIFNRSFRSGIIPAQWKLSIIKPILKPCKTASDPSSYRPISLLCNISKVFERLVFNRLYRYCEHNNLLSDNQYGVRKSRSTVDALLCFANAITNSFC